MRRKAYLKRRRRRKMNAGGVAQQLMQIEAEAKVGAEKEKHSKDRKAYLSEARVQKLDARLGKQYLYIPKLCKGGYIYILFFITERKHFELALVALIQETFINGVSTWRIEQLAKAIGIEKISASQVSEIAKGPKEHVEAFRTPPLEEVSTGMQ